MPSNDSAVCAKHALGWPYIHGACQSLARRLMPCGPFEYVVGIERGGLIPAALMQRFLNIPNFIPLRVVTYGDDNKKLPLEQRVIRWPRNPGEFGALQEARDKVLVVDDIWDTGETIRMVKGNLPQATYATIVAKSLRSYALPIYYYLNVDPSQWVIFPWETAAWEG